MRFSKAFRSLTLGCGVFLAALLPVVGSAPQSRFISRAMQGTPQKVVLYGTSLTFSGAWVPQLKSAVEEAYPGMVTWINSGGSGKASDWGVANLQTKVIDQNPDTVFIEFSMNDAATTLNISRSQALANLTGMVNGIKSAHPDTEIILQIMNPVDRRDGDPFSPRPDLSHYQQDYRDYATSNGLQYIDHMPAFTALLDEGSTAYRVFVPDGIHPSADGFAKYMTPVLFHAIGLQAEIPTEPSLVIDNTAAAPAVVFNGTWTPSTTNAGYIGTDYRHNGNTGQGTKSAVFTPTFTSAGTYPIFLRWTSETNRASNVPITVNYSGGSQQIMVNQRSNGGTWVKLGSFPFTAGASGTVTIGTTATDGFVIVDALGIGLNESLPVIHLRMNNGRAAEPPAQGGPARSSSLSVWRSGPTLADLTVPLNYTGGSAVSGGDYAALPASITIPAGQSSAAVDMLPLYDSLIEGEETFKVMLVPATGYSTGYPNKASIFIEDTAPTTGRATLIEENFSGSGALQGTAADAFAAALVTAGGTPTWAAASGFLQNGLVSNGNASAYLSLGSYINAAKNTANGKFELTMTLSEITGTWISLGFGAANTPATEQTFTSNDGMGTMIYRAQDTAPAGELDMFGGLANINAVDGPDGNTGTRTLTVTLDLTPAGGYNGTSNFGTVKWSDRVLGMLGAYTYTTVGNFGSILISTVSGSSGTISGLKLSQVMADTNYANWLATHSPASGFTTDSDGDGQPNGIENVLGSNPNTYSAGLTAVSSTANSVTLKHPLNPLIASDVSYSYQWSTDLVDWSASGATNPSGTTATITSSPPDANLMVTVVIVITAGPTAGLFGRLQVTKNP